MAKSGGVKRTAISLPKRVWEGGEQRMGELGYTKFSQYVAFLIVCDVERSKPGSEAQEIRELLQRPGKLLPDQVMREVEDTTQQQRAQESH